MIVTDLREIELLHTIEKIKRMNRAIAFHKAMDNTDTLALEQYIKVKKELTEQLIAFFSEIEVSIKLAA